MLLLLLVTNSYLGLDSIALCLSINMYTAHCMYIVYILFFKSSERQRTTSWPIRMPSFIYLLSIPLKFPIWSMRTAPYIISIQAKSQPCVFQVVRSSCAKPSRNAHSLKLPFSFWSPSQRYPCDVTILQLS